MVVEGSQSATVLNNSLMKDCFLDQAIHLDMPNKKELHCS